MIPQNHFDTKYRDALESSCFKVVAYIDADRHMGGISAYRDECDVVVILTGLMAHNTVEQIHSKIKGWRQTIVNLPASVSRWVAILQPIIKGMELTAPASVAEAKPVSITPPQLPPVYVPPPSPSKVEVTPEPETANMEENVDEEKEDESGEDESKELIEKIFEAYKKACLSGIADNILAYVNPIKKFPTKHAVDMFVRRRCDKGYGTKEFKDWLDNERRYAFGTGGRRKSISTSSVPAKNDEVELANLYATENESLKKKLKEAEDGLESIKAKYEAKIRECLDLQNERALLTEDLNKITEDFELTKGTIAKIQEENTSLRSSRSLFDENKLRQEITSLRGEVERWSKDARGYEVLVKELQKDALEKDRLILSLREAADSKSGVIAMLEAKLKQEQPQAPQAPPTMVEIKLNVPLTHELMQILLK